jgi:hypothetical protein
MKKNRQTEINGKRNGRKRKKKSKDERQRRKKGGK